MSGAIVTAAIAVHRELGPGLLESVYANCLAEELTAVGHHVARELTLPVVYRGRALAQTFRIDLLVDGRVIVEVKAVEFLLPVHAAQVLTYLRMANKRLGLLLNFHAPLMKNGIRRLIR